MVDLGEAPGNPRLVGRVAEENRLARLVGDIAAGQASVLVMRGIAGQGKTALLDWLAARARDDGFVVLRTTGVEFESGVAYSGLSAVLRPVMDRVDDLPAILAAALNGCAGARSGRRDCAGDV